MRPVGRLAFIAVVLPVLVVACGDQSVEVTPSSNPPANLDGAVSGQALEAPEVTTSENGRLTTTLNVARGEAEIAGVKLTALTYNSSFMPPLLQLHPGDHVEITVVNGLDEDTNLHTHGFHVSPIPPGDDVLMTIPAGESFTYVYDLPADHSPGTYWYHSHAHGISEGQVFAGMSGVIVVGGLEQRLPPEFSNVAQQVFALKDIQVKNGAIITDNIDSNASTIRLVNGQQNPTVSMRPGETQLWRLANVGADIFYDLSLGGTPFYVIAEDGNVVSAVRSYDDLVMPPGKRFDVLVQAPASGSMTLKTLAYDQQGDSYPEVALANVDISGDPAPALNIPSSLGDFTGSLTNATMDEQRTFTFTEDDKTSKFFINGKQFSHDRVDTTVRLGAVEEWTIKNDTTEQHPFHIHINDFQVMSVNGEPYHAVSLQDTVILPVHGNVVIRMHFKDFTGKYVYHCHILNHEDNGMMAVVEVVG